MDSPVCCAACGALNSLPPSMFNYFELFGIEPTYDIDPHELRRKYLSLSRSIHPDVAGQSSVEIRKRSLDLSSGLNRAYDTLRDPVARAEYLLAMAGGPSAADDKSVPDGLLGEVMMIREEIEEATETDDTPRQQAVREQISARQRASEDAIASSCRSADLKEPDARKQLREQLNAIKYWNNLLGQIPAGVE
jgi:molecular chaperone HscB